MKTIKEGSLWWAGDHKKFRVIGVVEVDGNTWVHYRDELKGWNQETANTYSCYAESFLQRFSPLPE